MDPQIENMAKDFLGNYAWLVIAGFLMVLFRSTLEGVVASFKIFFGGGLNTDDIIFIWIDKKYAARIVRVGIFKTVLTLYDVARTSDGEPYISGGEKFEIQNDKIKDFVITKPLTKVDLSAWANGFNGKKEKNNGKG